ncbi:MAG TPA: MarR family transcriptional regulator [Cryptosporangiaceae bacterium]|nr:MarR family transcriptional regulator [Cryptosporangiaceae bacterium]
MAETRRASRRSVAPTSPAAGRSAGNSAAADPLVAGWVSLVPEINAPVEGVVERIHLIERYLERLGSQVAAPHGLNTRDYDILARLFWTGAPHQLTPTQLATGTQAPATTITSRLDRLEGRGLIERVADPKDRRSLLARLTEEGRELFRRIVVEHARAEEALFDGISVADLERLRKLLDAVMARCEERLGPPTRRVSLALGGSTPGLT